MKRRLEQLKEASMKATLEEGERQHLRSSLLDYMQKNPVRENPPPALSPWKKFGSMNLILATVLILIAGFGTVSYAAEQALPGDTLYPVKRSVNEKVKGYFAFSDESKAELDVDLASRRLAEAEELQAKSRLNSETEASLSHDIDASLVSFKGHMSALASENAAADASHIKSEWQTSLSVHAAILPKLVSAHGIVESESDDDSGLHGGMTATSSAATTTIFKNDSKGGNAHATSSTKILLNEKDGNSKSSVSVDSRTEGGSSAAGHALEAAGDSEIKVDLR